MKKWQSLLFCDEEKGAKYFSILIFSRAKEKETENRSGFPHSFIHNNINNINKEKDDAGEKDNWGSFVIEYASSSFPVF